MNFVTTNIRLPEEDYLKLKNEAAKRRKSLAAVIRERISARPDGFRSAEEVKKIMDDLRKHGRENAQYLKGLDGVQIIREMRDHTKW